MFCIPEVGIGGEVAEVGFLLADIGAATFEIDRRFTEDESVLGVDDGADGIGHCFHRATAGADGVGIGNTPLGRDGGGGDGDVVAGAVHGSDVTSGVEVHHKATEVLILAVSADDGDRAAVEVSGAEGIRTGG